MTTRVTFICHGPMALRVTPVNVNNGQPIIGADRFTIQPGRFNDAYYIHSGVSFKVDEVLPA